MPSADNVHPQGCLDLELYLAHAKPDRPENWIEAADTWADRVVNGQTGARGDPGTTRRTSASSSPSHRSMARRASRPICGERRAPVRKSRPDPSESPDDDDGGGLGGGGGGAGHPDPRLHPEPTTRHGALNGELLPLLRSGAVVAGQPLTGWVDDEATQPA